MVSSVGDLDCLVLQAVKLRDVESWGRQDPLVVVEVAGQKMSTKTKTDAGKNPVWNERFKFVQINPAFATEMSVRVMDKNVMASDTEIGHARVPLTAIYSKATQELRIPLVSPKGKSAGELQLLLTFKPYAQQAAQHHMAPQQVMQAAPVYAQAAAPAYAQPAAPMYAAVPAYAPAPVQPAPMYAMQYAAAAPAGYPSGGYAAPPAPAYGYPPQAAPSYMPQPYPAASYYPAL
ncbi:hypothetical protein N2152v2_007266 [Parachlorella kessleri]